MNRRLSLHHAWVALKLVQNSRVGQKEETVRRLYELRVEHRDLDDAINALIQSDYVDHLQIKRLKKKKLLIKDAIERLKSKLIPDMDA